MASSSYRPTPTEDKQTKERYSNYWNKVRGQIEPKSGTHDFQSYETHEKLLMIERATSQLKYLGQNMDDEDKQLYLNCAAIVHGVLRFKLLQFNTFGQNEKTFITFFIDPLIFLLEQKNLTPKLLKEKLKIIVSAVFVHARKVDPREKLTGEQSTISYLMLFLTKHDDPSTRRDRMVAFTRTLILLFDKEEKGILLERLKMIPAPKSEDDSEPLRQFIWIWERLEERMTWILIHYQP